MTDWAGQLAGKIDQRTARVVVIGVGYVGLPLAIAVSRAGFPMIGFDVSRERVARLASGDTGLAHLSPLELLEQLERGLEFTADPRALRGRDVFLICVPTGLKDGVPDLAHIRAAVETVAAIAEPGSLVSLESTTYPGTTRELVQPYMAEGVFVCYSPEREDPGRASHDLATTPKLVGGMTSACSEAGQRFYSTIVRNVIAVSSPEAAEMAKLMENTFRAVNIALANELKGACDALGVDFYAAMDAAATKPYGFMPFYPGPGVGGHCIPIDPVYLTWRARAAGARCVLTEAALRVNARAHERALCALNRGLNEIGVGARGSRVLLIGAAYKPLVGDTRESPFFRVLGDVLALGAQASYCDPLVPSIEHCGRTYASTNDFRGFDAAVIVTDQAGVDFERLRARVPLIVDCRRSYADEHPRVVRA